MADFSAGQTLHHLLVIEDGAVQTNSLFLSERALAKALIEELLNDEYAVDSDDVQDVMDEADQDAAGAEYPEGCSEPPATPEGYLDCLRELLSNEGIDLHVDTIDLPESPVPA